MKNNRISLFQIKKIVIRQIPLLISGFICLALLLVIVYQYNRFSIRSAEVDALETEVKSLTEKVKTMQLNKTLSEDQIQQYNKLIASLIPESEDFFSIIYALEEISEKTSFSITGYSIDLTKSNNTKISFAVEGKGNAESFLNFLQEYQFSGGRLITSDKIEYSGSNISNVRITLNFYNKKTQLTDSSQIPQLSKKDIEEIELIKKKITITYTAEDYKIPDAAYETKENPFIP